MSASTARRVGSSRQAVDGHDREELVDGPDVGQRLEHREVAEVGVRQRALEALELLGHLAQLAHQLQDLLADGPEDVLGDHALGQRQVPEREQRQRLFRYSSGVVVGLAHVLARDVARRSSNRLRTTREAFVGQLLGRLAHVELADAQHVDDQHRVVGDHRAARLGDDGRVRRRRPASQISCSAEHDVVGVLLHGVVHRRGEVGLRAVVVDAQAAADVEVLERRAQLARSRRRSGPPRAARS